jgi:hypothetical protein
MLSASQLDRHLIVSWLTSVMSSSPKLAASSLFQSEHFSQFLDIFSFNSAAKLEADSAIG